MDRFGLSSQRRLQSAQYCWYFNSRRNRAFRFVERLVRRGNSQLPAPASGIVGTGQFSSPTTQRAVKRRAVLYLHRKAPSSPILSAP